LCHFSASLGISRCPRPEKQWGAAGIGEKAEKGGHESLMALQCMQFQVLKDIWDGDAHPILL
jgi:hypothetical protein